MAREYVRDHAGRVLGWYETIRGERIDALDASGERLASYHVRSNETRDAAGRLIARRNVLATFLVPPLRIEPASACRLCSIGGPGRAALEGPVA